MYSDIKNVTILVTLLKQFGIKDIVLSPGGSDIPLIHMIESDSFFKCHSVVDERSAAYFALGLAQGGNRIAACICTSGTAACNYIPGITEAFYQDVPVLAITADKNLYYQGQLETQKIDQTHLFDGVVRKSVDLPHVNSEDDYWLCNRLVNEALISLTHRGSGPAHINIPVLGRTDLYHKGTPNVERMIKVVNPLNEYTDANTYSQLLSGKRIMVVVGQGIVFSETDKSNMQKFFEDYNCMFAIEHLSNLQIEGCINTYPITEMKGLYDKPHLKPDIVISLGDNLSAYELKPFLRSKYTDMENWLVKQSGIVRDAYKSLTNIFECSASYFFQWMGNADIKPAKKENSYYKSWQKEVSLVSIEKFDFGNMYVAEKLSQGIPAGSLLHLAILNSTRVMQFFPLADGVRTYSNVGALGIDGCMSTFAGQAANVDTLAFLLIGDLSFFYDMNASSLRSIGKNVRIILLNNGGGSEFHFFMGRDRIPTIDSYICAKHSNTAAGWINSLGYDYHSASNKEEFENSIAAFFQPSEKPMFMEVFTKMDDDAKRTREIYNTNRDSGKPKTVKNLVKKILSPEQIKKAKSFIKKD